jgi:hypothetical protein
VRSTAGKLMTIPILLPQPLAAARCKSAAARFDSRKVNAPLTERSYPISKSELLQQSRSHHAERITRTACQSARAAQETGSICRDWLDLRPILLRVLTDLYQQPPVHTPEAARRLITIWRTAEGGTSQGSAKNGPFRSRHNRGNGGRTGPPPR